MRHAALALCALVAACDSGQDGAAVEQDARRILYSTDEAPEESDHDAPALASATSKLPTSPWICTDPMSHSVEPTQGTILVQGRSSERGPAGLVLRRPSDSGPWSVHARIRVNRLAFACDLRFGIGSLGGATNRRREQLTDPVVELSFGCHGGEGDLRLTAAMRCAGMDAQQGAILGAFELGQDIDCTLECDGREVTALVRFPGHPGRELRKRITGTLPAGLFVLGSLQRIGQGGIVDAEIELLSVAGNLEAVTAADVRIADWLANRQSSLRNGPLAELLRQLEATAPWPTTAGAIRPQITKMRSLLGYPTNQAEADSWLLQGWFEAAELRRAPPEARVGRVVEPLTQELNRALSQRATFPLSQALIQDWLGPSMTVDMQQAQRAALLHHLAAVEDSPTVSRQHREEALRTCPGDFLARTLFEALRAEKQPCPTLVHYLLQSDSDPRLAASYALQLLDNGHAETARELAARALGGGVCDDDFGRLLARLPDPEPLRADWTASRAEGLLLLRELTQRQRWMGLADSADHSARTLLLHDRSPEAVRAAVPSLLLAHDKEQLLELLRSGDPRIRDAVKAGLHDDPVLYDLRAAFCADLPL